MLHCKRIHGNLSKMNFQLAASAAILCAALCGCSHYGDSKKILADPVPDAQNIASAALAAAAQPGESAAPAPDDAACVNPPRFIPGLDSLPLDAIACAAGQAHPQFLQGKADIAYEAARAAARFADFGWAPQGRAGAASPESPVGAGASNPSATAEVWATVPLFGQSNAEAAAADALLRAQKAAASAGNSAAAASAVQAFADFAAATKNLQILQDDLLLRKSQQQLTERLAKAGFEPESALAQNEAGILQAEADIRAAALAANRLLLQTFALTGLSSETIRRLAGEFLANPPPPRAFEPPKYPEAQALLRRRDVQAKIAEIYREAQAAFDNESASLPRVSVAGNISAEIGAWRPRQDKSLSFSIGPISVAFPLLNGKTTEAWRSARQERLLALRSEFAMALRQAAGETAQAIQELRERTRAQSLLLKSRAQYRNVNQAIALRYKAGLASLLELESSRRDALAVESKILDNEAALLRARIALFCATAGGL